MFSLLIALIYLAFISLGLPDSLLGSAWPVMRLEFGAELSFAGVISMLIAGCTILSSLMSDAVTRRLGAGLTTAVSVGMTAAALFGFSIAPNPIVMCILAVPYGLGAGAVDAALNNYVALHLAARHMSWLHMCWGIGASISPFIMSANLANANNWRGGYLTVSGIQIVLAVILIATLPVWKKKAEGNAANQVTAAPIGIRGALKIKGVPYMLTAFFGYCAMEAVCFMWASSYLVEYRSIDSQTAAMFASLAYLGLTGGRFINGFIADKLGDRALIRIGSAVILVGLALIALPLPGDITALAGILITGFGCAPIYPSIIHATPANFGRENSQAIVGIQMASAYTGSTFMPPLFGLFGEHISMGLYPYFMLVFTLLMIVMSERLNRVVKV